MQCPIDQTPLSLRTVEGKSLHLCTQCNGHFLTADAIAELRANAAIQIHLHEKQSFRVSRRDGLSLLSPCHAVSMHTLFFRGVEIDVCPQCYAVWLDSDELQRVLQQVKFSKVEDLSGVAATKPEFETSVAKGDGLDVIEVIADLVEAVASFVD
ncbi:zf-TFIIB domain-containing protein [Undibacterium cyanobacteriorum]|uniref:Zf-TFIIB domain-containing protein n=1 Tax=Undibacterium cyanobacteriorum TaxID=3073561 RepID=A0ABY9RJE6_9BURK|nr:zf-TFIIB domain-containing protein [Undibacterium sp. 20NA77.5]WMW80790.1 zf-TFIIB domain-containing protein [Undibacterium sp. 20NA77.5]